MLAYMNKFAKSRGCVVAPINDVLRDATFVAIQDVFGWAGLKQGADWEYNKTERELTLFNGSRAFFRTAEDPENLPGTDLAWAWLDEWRQMTFRVFQKLQPALRQPGYPHQLWATSTGGGKRHWARKVWLPKTYAREFEEEPFERPLGLYKTYVAPTKQNPFGGEQTYQMMVGTYGENTPIARQELWGEEIIMENLVFPTWSPRLHVLPEEEWPTRSPQRVIAGVDFGFRVPSTILVEGVDELGHHYIMDEVYRPKLSEQELVASAQALRQKYNIRRFFCDSADPRWVMALRNGRLPADYANKRVGATSDPTSRLGLCTATLNEPIGDRRRLIVAPRCKNFIREIENYIYAEGSLTKDPTERPLKKGDHLMDAWGYAEMGLAFLYGRPKVQGKQIAVSVGA